jgi:Spy/CpxP family protein refolding chaperone
LRKQFLFIACLFALLLAAPQVTRAQDTASGQDQAGGWPTPEQVVEKLGQKLSLTDDQKAKITPIIADRQQKIKALATDNSGRRFKKARKMKSIFSESDKKIKAVLTDEQKQKYTEMEQQMRDQARQRMQERRASGSSQ